MPTSAHFIYIPAVLILGLVLGFVWGARLTREAFVLEAKRLEERTQKRAQRAAERAASAGATAGTTEDDAPASPLNEKENDARKS